jgi:hypothetical protein
MNNKIKSITAYHIDFMPGDEEQDEIQVEGYKTALEEFDNSSNLIKEVTLDENENIEQIYVYKYNDNGKMTEEILYYESDEVIHKKTYTINEKGQRIKEIVHYSEEEYDTIIYTYNDKDQLTEKINYNIDEEIESTQKFIYLNQNLVEDSIYDGKNKLLFQKLYKYDEKGNEIEFQSNDLVEDIKFSKEYSYDDLGRRIESLTYNEKNQLKEKSIFEYTTGNKPTQITEETAFKKNTAKFSYDEKGNIICQEEYNRNNNLINSIKRVYDENNNLLESDIIINNIKDDISQHYKMKNEYEFF